MPHPAEWLGEMGIARFEADGSKFPSLYHEWGGAHRPSANRPDFVQDYIELGAVEFALAPQIVSAALGARPATIPILPVDVSSEHLGLAGLKTNCGPFGEHKIKGLDDLRPWDVFAFSGDMSKAELLDAQDVNALANPYAMEHFIVELARRYRSAGLGPALVDSGVLAAQGVVWYAKLALLRGEDPTQAQNLRFTEYA